MVGLDQDDIDMFSTALHDIEREIQDPWDRDSLAKDLYLRFVGGTANDQIEMAGRAFDAADVFMAELKRRRAK